MFLSPETMRLLMELDAPIEQKVALLNSMRADEEVVVLAQKRRTITRERRAKHRAKDEAEAPAPESVTKRDNALDGVTERDEALPDVSTRPLPPSPQTPQPPTPTRGSVNTRESAREDAAFVRFWADYPRKTAKADARKAFSRAWKKLPPHDEEAVLIGGLERAKAGWVDAQFIPHAATWLNGERWTDEPSTVTPLRAHERPHTDHRQAARDDSLRNLHAGAMAAVNRRLG